MIVVRCCGSSSCLQPPSGVGGRAACSRQDVHGSKRDGLSQGPTSMQHQNRNGFCDWFFVNKRWYCRDCFSYKATVEKPAPCKCPGHSQALRRLFQNPQGHKLEALWVGDGLRPVIFCGKCTRWCYSRPVKLAEACKPPETLGQKRAWRDSKQRVANGLHPHCNVSDRVLARAPIAFGAARLDWAGPLNQALL